MQLKLLYQVQSGNFVQIARLQPRKAILSAGCLMETNLMWRFASPRRQMPDDDQTTEPCAAGHGMKMTLGSPVIPRKGTGRGATFPFWAFHMRQCRAEPGMWRTSAINVYPRAEMNSEYLWLGKNHAICPLQ